MQKHKLSYECGTVLEGKDEAADEVEQCKRREETKKQKPGLGAERRHT